MSDKLESKLAEWYEHPSQMVRELFGAEPDPWQEEALENYRDTRRLAIIGCKGPGKSSVLAWIAWNFLLTRPFPKMAVTSISGDNLRDGFWSEMAKWRNKSELLQAMFEHTATRIFNKQHMPELWSLSFRTWPKTGTAEEQTQTLAGLHDDYMMFLIDESGSVPDAVMAAAQGILTGGFKEAHLIQAGNPTSLSGPLYRASRTPDLWYIIRITGDPDNPKRTTRMPIEYAREQIAEYGRHHPYVLVNVFGEFPPSSLNALIGPDEVRAAMRRYYRPYELDGVSRIIAADVARYGDDENSLAFREGPQAYPFRTYRNIDGRQGAAILNREATRWEPDAIFLDGTGGWATSWEDHLRTLGRAPVSVQFNASAHQKMRFENKRAEMYWDMCEWIRHGGALPPDEEFLRELTETTYSIPKDVIILEPKAALKSRLGRSPNKADSLALTFAEPVTAGRRSALPIERRMQADYDPFAGMDGPMDTGRERNYAAGYDPYGGNR